MGAPRYYPLRKGGDNGSKIHIFDSFGLWVPEHIQLLSFWKISKALGTSAKNAAKTIVSKADDSY